MEWIQISSPHANLNAGKITPVSGIATVLLDVSLQCICFDGLLKSPEIMHCHGIVYVLFGAYNLVRISFTAACITP